MTSDVRNPRVFVFLFTGYLTPVCGIQATTSQHADKFTSVPF